MAPTGVCLNLDLEDLGLFWLELAKVGNLMVWKVHMFDQKVTFVISELVRFLVVHQLETVHIVLTQFNHHSVCCQHRVITALHLLSVPHVVIQVIRVSRRVNNLVIRELVLIVGT